MAKTKRKDEFCLVCGTNKGRMTRGLCSTHHQALHRKLSKLTSEGREQFELMLIENGKLLPARPGNRPKSEDPFGIEFDQLLSDHPEFHAASKPADDLSVEEILSRARQKKKKSE